MTASGPTTQRSSEPTTQAASEPTAQATTQEAARPAAGPRTEPSTEPITEPAAAAGQMPTAAEPAPAELTARADAVAVALDAARDEIGPDLAARARADLDRVRHRLELGADRTVVALVGGTGSGKSSLFNAISGLEFADVGELRPTTEVAAACVWGGPADPLLDFLQVSRERRIGRESVLDGEHERALHGMVLLDLPDHDSVATEHADQVDRLVPLVDLLVWVVDPQKYADNLLHSRYLTALAGRQGSMLVLVNQADTLPPAAVDRVRADVAALLAAEGLPSVPVLATSAVDHTGIAEVRARLAAAVARPSAAARTAAAELAAVAARLEPALGRVDPAALDDDARDRASADLARAAGADAVAAAVAAGTRTLARPQAPAAASVAAVRDAWVAGVVAHLPDRWADAVDRAVAPTTALVPATAAAVADVPLPARPSRPRRLALAAAGLALVAVVAVVVAVVADVGWPLLVPAVLAVAGAGALLALARTARRSAATAAAAGYRAAVADRVRGVVEEHLVAPTQDVLARHDRLRRTLDG
ncbi:GTPase [Georgenia sp. TF02-10]|uniref:GTPase n=1 Tax=Georgenia sp. TF02-10 TaxID=2917725 RepID=UPI00211384BB|nr:GTPase [Georgenia sp. TF02-10]